jgi:hypothetical protein
MLATPGQYLVCHAWAAGFDGIPEILNKRSPIRSQRSKHRAVPLLVEITVVACSAFTVGPRRTLC